MDERLKFVAACLAGDQPMAWICEAFGVSRKTGYKWLSRYQRLGISGLNDLPRAPLRPARAMPVDVREKILALRERKPHWGPKKLRATLIELYPEMTWPVLSSIGDLLLREGLVKSRRKRRRTPPYEQPLAHAEMANDVWCADYKGWVRTGDGKRCDPLTVSDGFSRFLLAAQVVPRLDHENARQVFARLFHDYGLPKAIRTDNGVPFASVGAGGLSALAVWWLKLGIRPERIDPGKPQQNGRHERMHRTMLEDAMDPPAPTAAAQQARLNAFREEYNHERPHEALGQQPPARLYQCSGRPYDGLERDPTYAVDQAVRRVRSNGEIKWAGRLVFISEVLVGEPVAVSEAEDGTCVVHFFDVRLGYIHPDARKLLRFQRGHAPAESKKVLPMSPV